MRLQALIVGLVLISLFIIKTQDVTFNQVNEKIDLGQIIWDVRLTDTLLQSIIIFSSIISVITVMRGEKVE